jgi:hypothetical protein
LKGGDYLSMRLKTWEGDDLLKPLY